MLFIYKIYIIIDIYTVRQFMQNDEIITFNTHTHLERKREPTDIFTQEISRQYLVHHNYSFWTAIAGRALILKRLP